MSTTKCPFMVFPNVLSPLICQDIIDNVTFAPPIQLDNNKLNFVTTHDEYYQNIVFKYISQYIPDIEQHYGHTHRGTELLNFEWIPTGSHIPAHSENAELINNKWVQTKRRDFTGIIFLMDYNDEPPLDDDFECYGGKLEFINHKFGFNPTRGLMVVFPSEPRFTNGSSTVFAGDSYQIRFHMSSETLYIHNPKLFAGDYRSWF